MLLNKRQMSVLMEIERYTKSAAITKHFYLLQWAPKTVQWFVDNSLAIVHGGQATLTDKGRSVLATLK